MKGFWVFLCNSADCFRGGSGQGFCFLLDYCLESVYDASLEDPFFTISEMKKLRIPHLGFSRFFYGKFSF